MRINSRRSEQLTEQPVSLDESSEPSAADAPSEGTAVGGFRVTRAAAVRGVVALIAFIAILIAAYYIPLPSIGTLRTWSGSLGSWFVVVFFLAYAVVAASPIPRTPFTFAAGVLFPPVVAFAGVTVAATVAAVAAFYLARALGRERVRPYLTHPTIATVESRLRQRGWLAVGSLRLIAVCPFSLVNYLSGLSSVRVSAFTMATVIGMTPGNASLIFLGDALAGAKSPISLIFSGILFSIGVIGLIVDSRLPVNPKTSSKDA
ncbi:TVP38/TMEM64 family protein [Gordonia phthalatica]|uniref:TVP38/TMEM64 family membrane protein n=1 Tax=Gordonia phthalatica TaxID=1136941 RepID=A0A0N9NHB1_9ACTN|nr:TVP38/TMEM64 family protein [Gordonia phthalatica]ALG84822.1 membrane protein [Gordonia phthalatica]